MTKTYTATAAREGRWWVVTVPGVGVTQARSLRDAPAMARDLIAALEDVDVDTVSVDVRPDLTGQLMAKVQKARQEAAEAAERQRLAAALSRDVVAELKATGINAGDVAAILGVSPQRVSQLSKAGDRPAR